VQDNLKHLVIIIPCYNEQECIRSIYEEISVVMRDVADWTYSICYVDDGSRDNTLAEVKTLAESDSSVGYITFSRNFGKEAAIHAGLRSSHGDAAVIMDADHQDPPAILPQMLELLNNGYDMIAVRRTDRKGEPFVRSWFANKFYVLMNKFSGIHMESGARDYRLMTAQVRDALLSLSERERFSKGLFTWVGFNVKWLDIPNVQRAAGNTSWSFWALLKYSISGIVAFTTAPLRLALIIGGFTVTSGIIYFIYRIIRYRFLLTTDAIIIALMLIIGGVTIGLLGIIGEYLARMYSEVKHRPLYIIKEKNRN
jgi:glycosyltransferase involved in cell wall biosynthesis